MPDGKDKKYVSDPSLLSQLNDAPAVSAPSEKKYVSDPALVEALESAPASQESVVPQSGSEVIQTEQGEVSIRPGVSPEKVRKDRSLHAKLNNIPTENVAKDLSFATDVVNKLYGKQFTAPQTSVTVEKVGTTQSGIPASTERTYTTDGTVTETSTVGITPEMVANKDAAVQSIRNEISAAPDYLKRDVEATMANLPDWAKDGFGSVGVDIESKVQEMVDPKGRPGALKEYMQARLPFLESSRQKEIQELDKIYPVQRQTYRVGDNIRERITRENEAEYNAQLDQINEKYGEEKEALSNSAFMLASQKVVSQLMRSNKDLVNVNPYQVGAEVERILGDEEVVNRDERLWRKYSDTDPTTKVNREIQGYQALEAAKYAAIAEGDEVTAKRLAEITDNYPEKVREDNPQFVKQQKAAALRNQISKDNNTFWDSFAGVTVDNEKIQKAASELGWTAQDIQGITDEDVKNVPGAARIAASSFVANSAAPAAEFAYRHLGIESALEQSGLVDPDKSQKLFGSGNWYDKSPVGNYLLSKQPAAREFIEFPTEIQTNSASEDFLFDVSNMASGKFNVSGATIGNAMFNGVGQIAALSTNAGLTGRALKGASLIDDAAKAREVGFMLSNYITGYDRNYRDAAQYVTGNDDASEAKRVALANFKTGVEVWTERFLPDYEITDLFKTPSGRALINQISEKGIGALNKSSMVDGVKKMLIESGSGIAKEGVEESTGAIANGVGDFFFAPEKFQETNYVDEAVKAGVLGAVSSVLPIASGNMVRYRNNSGPVTRSLVYDVGKRPEFYIEGINKEVEAGTLPQPEANAKIQTVNTLANIVKNSVPDESLVNNQKLTDKQKAEYTDLRLQESILNAKKEAVEDPVQEKYIDEQLHNIQTRKENILATAGVDGIIISSPQNQLPNETERQEEGQQVLDDPALSSVTETIQQPEESEAMVGATTPSTVLDEKVTSEQEEVVLPEDNITVGELIDKPILYNGQRARIYQDGQTLVAKIEGSNREYELGNVEEVSPLSIKEFGIDQESSVVSTDEAGNIVVRGQTYRNLYSDPLSAINYDDQGNLQSVTLDTENGQKRTFRGAVAEDVAYQIVLQQISNSNEQQEVEAFLNSDEETKREVDAARSVLAAESETATGDAEVSRIQAQRTTPTVINTEQNATEESIQQQQEVTEQGGVGQYTGTQEGQPEIGERTGSERQAAQPETDSRNSDSGIQAQEVVPEESATMDGVNSSKDVSDTSGAVPLLQDTDRPPLSSSEAEKGTYLMNKLRSWKVSVKDKMIVQDVKNTHETRSGESLLSDDYMRAQSDKMATDLSMDAIVEEANALLGDNMLGFMLNTITEENGLDLETKQAISQSLLRQNFPSDVTNNIRKVDKELARRASDTFMIRRATRGEEELTDEQQEQITSALGEEGVVIEQSATVLEDAFSDNAIPEAVQSEVQEVLESQTESEINKDISSIKETPATNSKKKKPVKINVNEYAAKKKILGEKLKGASGFNFMSNIVDKINEVAKKC